MSNIERENRDWSDAIRDSLRDAEQMPSSELWSRIERSAPPVVNRRLTLQRWTMAVAATLLLGLFASNFITSHVESEGGATVEEVQPVMSYNEEAESVELESYIAQSEPVVKRVVYVDQSKVVEPISTLEQLKQQANKIVESTENVEQNEPKQAKRRTEKSQQESKYRVQEPLKYYPPKREKAGATLAVNFSGGGSSSGTPARSPFTPQGILSPTGYKAVSLMEIYEASDISHRQPLSFELSVGLPIANKLSLVSGVNYTLLNSELTVLNGQNIPQRVQFVGVPLRLETPIWSGDRLSLYAGAGGALEYCLSATVDGESVDERRWHTSVGGSIGAQYNLSQTIGLYCEPDLSYYFTPTQLITVRSESPLAFTMRFGVRFAL